MLAGTRVTRNVQDATQRWEFLSAEQAALVFPLVVAVDGPIHDLARWRRLVGDWVGAGNWQREPRGIVGLRHGRRTIFSAFLFEVRGRGLVGTSLCIPRIWLVELGVPGRATEATLEVIELLARQHGCETIAVELALRDGPAREIARALNRIEAARVPANDAPPGAHAAKGHVVAFPRIPR